MDKEKIIMDLIKKELLLEKFDFEAIDEHINERVDDAIKNMLYQLFGKENIEDIHIKRDEDNMANVEITFVENEYTSLVVNIINKGDDIDE